MVHDKNSLSETEKVNYNWRYPSSSNRRSEFVESSTSFKKNFSIADLKTGKTKHTTQKRFNPNWNAGMPMLYDSNEDAIYFDISDSHSLVFGSTGSKKTRLLVMPAVYLLAMAGESMIISDPKAEVYDRTAALLERQGYRISVINLRDPMMGNQWNPLAIPYSFYRNGDQDRACEFVNDIANNLMLSEVAVQDPFWDHSAADLLFGLIMLLFKYCKEYKYGPENVNMRAIQKLRVELFRNNAKASKLWGFAQQNEIITASLLGTINAPDKTQASILSVYDDKMRLFQMSSSLVEMLSGNDIDLSNFDNGRRAIYLILPDEKTSYHRIASLFIKQSYEYLLYIAHEKRSNALTHRLNYVLDEFSALPPINDFSTIISAARSRNIRFHLVVQSKHQLVQKYSADAQTIMSNCLNWFFLTSRELDLLREVSDLCGNDKDQKPIVTIQELQRLDKEKGECLILSGRLRPYISILLDIEGYDNGRYRIRPIPRRPATVPPVLCVDGFNIGASNTDATEDDEADDHNDWLGKKFDELFEKIEELEDGGDSNDEE